jgi:hypothetical protein
MTSLFDMEFISKHEELLCNSYLKITGKNLIVPPIFDTDIAVAEALFTAPFALVSHNAESDPVFNFGNQTALSLFEMTWETFTRLPSRLSAEPENRAARAALLNQVASQGFIDNYSGIRISATGKRFRIHRATVWNITDDNLNVIGQAAMFKDWQYI